MQKKGQLMHHFYFVAYTIKNTVEGSPLPFLLPHFLLKSLKDWITGVYYPAQSSILTLYIHAVSAIVHPKNIARTALVLLGKSSQRVFGSRLEGHCPVKSCSWCMFQDIMIQGWLVTVHLNSGHSMPFLSIIFLKTLTGPLRTERKWMPLSSLFMLALAHSSNHLTIILSIPVF